MKLKQFIERSDGSAKGDGDVSITIDMLELANEIDVGVSADLFYVSETRARAERGESRGNFQMARANYRSAVAGEPLRTQLRQRMHAMLKKAATKAPSK